MRLRRVIHIIRFGGGNVYHVFGASIIRGIDALLLPSFSMIACPFFSLHCCGMFTARAKSILAILSFQPETMAQIRGMGQSLRGARCAVPPLVTIPFLKSDGWHDSDHVSAYPDFEWKSKVISHKLVCFHCHHVFLFSH